MANYRKRDRGVSRGSRACDIARTLGAALHVTPTPYPTPYPLPLDPSSANLSSAAPIRGLPLTCYPLPLTRNPLLCCRHGSKLTLALTDIDNPLSIGVRVNPEGKREGVTSTFSRFLSRLSATPFLCCRHGSAASWKLDPWTLATWKRVKLDTPSIPGNALALDIADMEARAGVPLQPLAVTPYGSSSRALDGNPALCREGGPGRRSSYAQHEHWAEVISRAAKNPRQTPFHIDDMGVTT